MEMVPIGMIDDFRHFEERSLCIGLCIYILLSCFRRILFVKIRLCRFYKFNITDRFRSSLFDELENWLKFWCLIRSEQFQAFNMIEIFSLLMLGNRDVSESFVVCSLFFLEVI